MLISKYIRFGFPVFAGWWYPAQYNGNALIKHVSGHPPLSVDVVITGSEPTDIVPTKFGGGEASGRSPEDIIASVEAVKNCGGARGFFAQNSYPASARAGVVLDAGETL